VLFAPALGELYTAVAGGAALKNGEPIHVSGPAGEDTHRLAVSEEMLAGCEPDFRERVTRVKHVPSLAYRLAMVADGRLEGTLVKRNSHDWDLAAADLILERAGGTLSDLEGKPLTYNRAEVVHGELCGAALVHHKALLRQLAHRRDS
jgi:myo-inositol-1(or 4)-monophosphatase